MRKAKAKPKPNRGVLAARYTRSEWRPSREPDGRLLSAGSAAEAGKGSGSATSILIVLLLGGSVLLLGAAVVPDALLPPSRFGALIARHRADLATAGATATLCLLCAFLIARAV